MWYTDFVNQYRKGIPIMSKNSPLLQPIQVGNLTLKNRIMFPPLTTGYEERDGSIGPRSLAFYERLARAAPPSWSSATWLPL